MNKVDKAVIKNTDSLMRKANVVMVAAGVKVTGGVNTGQPAVVIGVIKKLPVSVLAVQDVVPLRVSGVETDVIEVGEIKALSAVEHRKAADTTQQYNRKKEWRPAPGGVSIGHYKITAGTLGMVVKKGCNRMILSNNHVLANSNECEIGDPILQPGVYDGGLISDSKIAELEAFISIVYEDDEPPSNCLFSKLFIAALNGLYKLLGRKTRFKMFIPAESVDNLVDAAIAKPLDENDLSFDVLEIPGIKVDTAEPEVGMEVQKSGRTTGHSKGPVEYINAAVRVLYGSRYALFHEQFGFVGENIVGGGDSGSVVFDMQGKRVGLLFAGNSDGTLAICNKYPLVKELLSLD